MAFLSDSSYFNVVLSIFVVQGPLAGPVLQYLTKDDLSKFYFGEFRMLDINGVHCFLTRTGYASLVICFPKMTSGFTWLGE